MNILDRLYTKHLLFQRTIGLSPKQFDIFLINFEIALQSIKNSSGRPYSLNCKHLLMTILMYYKSYMTQEFIGWLVRIDQSNISRLLTKTRELIEQSADPELKTYVEKLKEEFNQIPLKDRINDFQSFFKKYPEMKEVIIDATEQKCFRSKQNDVQKAYYSGKKKQHTRKTQITVSRSGKILDVSATYPGSVHDKTIIDQEQTVKKFPKKTTQRLDLAYKGVPAENADYNVIIPFKKPKGKELNPLFKQFNHRHSKIRVKVENIFAEMKTCKILKNTYRGGSESYNQDFRNVAAIVNFKLRVAA